MTKAVRIHVNGGPEVLRYDDIALAPPGDCAARRAAAAELSDLTT